MKRYDLEFRPSLAGSDSEMVPRPDGDWVFAEEATYLMRESQRAMIAALYWRAGDAKANADDVLWPGNGEAQLDAAFTLMMAARAMESRL